MDAKQILMVAVIFSGIGAWYWFKVLRHGGTGGYMRHKLGLQDGEEIAKRWMAYYDIDRTTGEKLGEIVGVRTRGKNVMVALTNRGRLTIGDNETSNPPLGFDRGQVAVSEYPKKAEMGTIAGPGGLEQAVVMLLAPVGAEPFRLQIARSALTEAEAWSRTA